MAAKLTATLAATTDDPVVANPVYGIRGFSVQCVHTGGTSIVEGSNNGTDWHAVGLIPVGDPGGTVITSIVASGMWYNPDATFDQLRVRKTVNGAQVLTLFINE